jgi:branched-chain amino acid transport system permease protein
MVSLADTLIQGVLLGGLYALFAAGLSLIFGVMRLVNLAHGDLIVLAAFLILTLVTALGLNAFVATLIAAPIMFAIGYALQAQVLNRTLGPDILPPLLVTFGLSIVIQNGLLEAFSADSCRINVGWLETAFAAADQCRRHAAAHIRLALAVIVGSISCSIAPRSAARVSRASDDKVTASLGIRPDRIFATATGIAMVVAAIAALSRRARQFRSHNRSGALIYAFEAVIIGGLGSMWGTLAGGVIIGSRRPSAPRSIPVADSPQPCRFHCRASHQAARSSFRAQPIGGPSWKRRRRAGRSRPGQKLPRSSPSS